MNQEEYFESRVDDQIGWYSKESKFNQNWFKRLRIVEIVAAAIIPFLAGVNDSIPYSNWFIGVLGVIIADSAAVSSLFKFQENWIQYRTTAESLKHEKYLFLTQTSPYQVDDPFQLFVQNIESLISKENRQWAKQVWKKSKQPNA